MIFFSQKYLQWNWDFHSDALIIQRVDFIRLIHTELRKKAKRKYHDYMSPFNKELKSQGPHYLNFFSLPTDTFGLISIISLFSLILVHVSSFDTTLNSLPLTVIT